MTKSEIIKKLMLVKHVAEWQHSKFYAEGLTPDDLIGDIEDQELTLGVCPDIIGAELEDIVEYLIFEDNFDKLDLQAQRDYRADYCQVTNDAECFENYGDMVRYFDLHFGEFSTKYNIED